MDEVTVIGFVAGVAGFVFGRVVWDLIKREIDRKRLLCAISVEACGSLNVVDHLLPVLRLDAGQALPSTRSLGPLLGQVSSGYIVARCDWSASDLAVRLKPKESRQVIQYLDCWNRFTDFAQSYCDTYTRLLEIYGDGKEGSAATELLTQNLGDDLHSMIGLALEIRVKAALVVSACCRAHGEPADFDGDTLYEVSSERWRSHGDVLEFLQTQQEERRKYDAQPKREWVAPAVSQ